MSVPVVKSSYSTVFILYYILFYASSLPIVINHEVKEPYYSMLYRLEKGLISIERERERQRGEVNDTIA